MLGIIIGVSSVVVMMGLGAGAQKKVESQIDSLGTNMLRVRGAPRSSRGVSQGATGVARLVQGDAAAISEEITGVSYVAPYISGMVQVVRGNANWSTRVYGVTADYTEIHNWELVMGHALDLTDLNRNGKDIFLGATVAKELFGDENPLGQRIRINKVPFTVQGVFRARGESMTGSDQDDVMLAPIITVRKKLLGVRMSSPMAVDALSVQVTELDDMDRVSSDIQLLLNQRHRIRPTKENSFRITNMTQRMAMRAEASQVFNSLLAGVACVSLLVGGIGIMNIMLVSVTERTREIGIRLALGAKQSHVLLQFLIEAVVLCGIGGIFGILTAMLGLYGAEHLTGLPIYIQPWVSVASVMFSAMIGLFFGFYPARKASRLNPVEALRYD